MLPRRVMCNAALTVVVALLIGTRATSAQERVAELVELSQQIDALGDAGNYVEAGIVAERYIALARKHHGEDHREFASALLWRGRMHKAEGHYAEAEPLIKRALAIGEKVLGPDDAEVGHAVGHLASLYHFQGRYPEAEPLYFRAKDIFEKALHPNHVDQAKLLTAIGMFYSHQGRHALAAPMIEHSITILQRSSTPDHVQIATSLNHLANVRLGQGNDAEAKRLFQLSASIYEQHLGPNHTNVGVSIGALASMAHARGEYAEAEALERRSLAIFETSKGPDDPFLDTSLNLLGWIFFDQGDWGNATDHWRRSISVIMRRVTREGGQSLTGRATTDDVWSGRKFRNFIKAAYRLSVQSPSSKLSNEMFEVAQLALGSAAARSIAQMAARAGSGNAGLAALIRERQDLVDEWKKRDVVRSADLSRAPGKRDGANVARLEGIDARIAEIDQRLATEYPDFATLARLSPLGIEEVQSQLRSNEALLMILDAPSSKTTPEETFVWAITANNARIVRSDLRASVLTQEVATLRCGLDAAQWDDASGAARCRELVNSSPQRDEAGNTRPETLPFDTAQAHAIYNALFGQIEDLIREKHLLIVPAGSLTQLPFHVLIRDRSNLRRTEIGRIGVELGPISNELRSRLDLQPGLGVRVVRVIPGGPAEVVGLVVDDVVLSVDNLELSSVDQAVEAIRVRTPGTKATLVVSRNNARMQLAPTLGAATADGWTPRLLDPTAQTNVQWLARSHPTTVLPAVSSLKTLRRLAKGSQASKSMIGFGNPLLGGDPKERPWEGNWAKLAEQKQTCPRTPWQRIAGLFERRRSVTKIATRNGRADLEHLRMQQPLHDTADEICAVGSELRIASDDVYLGRRATETAVKQLSKNGGLAQYRVVHFATHGTVAGEIEGTSEPGLILTPPAEQTDEDDGYLSASEVAALNLNADWAILSACNTAAGGAKGAEALSGLARAFFHAGARSLLVSHWAVSSEATVKLITHAVGATNRDKGLGRAEALRRAMLNMIDSGAHQDAHPYFWAPFVVVGEGAASR
jgi:CHAT domain-containing protein/tetratricopeptide (TPR) repeat protein